MSDNYSNKSLYLSYKEGQLLILVLSGISNKCELIKGIWGQHNTIVSDSSYYKLIHLLRKKLMSMGLAKDTLRTQSRIGLIWTLPIEMVSIEASKNYQSTTTNTPLLPRCSPQQPGGLTSYQAENKEKNVRKLIGNLPILRVVNLHEISHHPYPPPTMRIGIKKNILPRSILPVIPHLFTFIQRPFIQRHNYFGVIVGIVITLANIIFLLSLLL